MPIKAKENLVGAWAFLIGVILAIAVGAVQGLPQVKIPFITEYSGAIAAVLVILGLMIGFLNVRTKDINTFLLAAVVLVIVSNMGKDIITGSLFTIPVANLVTQIFNSLLIVFVPATIIVALKSVFSVSKV